jgi:nucleotidyltransferase substrate binding protein (TIGR01987 family)
VYERYLGDPEDEISQIALIQAFEFTFEIAWKTMRDYVENEGYDGVGNSKQTVRVAVQAELIEDAENWMNAIAQRNMTRHVYNSVILQETISFIKDVFFPLVRYLPFFFDFVAYSSITNEALKAHIDHKGVLIYQKVEFVKGLDLSNC